MNIKNTLRSVLFISIIVLLSACGSSRQGSAYKDTRYPKREFRGAWLSTAWQSRYQSMTVAQMKAYFTKSLDQLQAMGINAVIFQARPFADAFYKSKYEPWSALLTGVQGVAPEGNFDPLAFLVSECHKRNMELHAWLNPYRVSSKEGERLASNHIYYKHPERFVTYGGKIYFDPGIPDNASYICKIVRDIVLRYDVDAIHMDDYFYPYPIAGEAFPDNNSFNTYARRQGFSANQKNDWRRNNVNQLIREIKHTLEITKPWVRLGISPFGIYRNKKNTPDGSGSNTNGLQNYDDLYADIKLWVKNGWIDYNMPQVYWEIGHSSADYKTLVKWWSENNFDGHLYIGQDVKRTMDGKTGSQLNEKMQLSRNPNLIHGNCFWPAYELLDNYKNIATQLKGNYHKYPALIPAYTHMHKKGPKKVKNLREEYTPTTHMLTWESKSEKYDPETAQYYVVYRFPKGVKEDIDDARYIVATTRQTKYILPYEGARNEYKYVVTAVDGFHNESKGKSKKIRL
ncbi:glycoside hydrolase family 10 protein [Dysgonomonas sp. 511]|uniref:glycoside hydrolase family 10 protein n=1 Tax=Dysgonomonas sp. 511 TaxID=2302930 RepID=UPI0013D6DDE4|nr:family 10 glycosylhydrolase [Dysgonomonas sp. 511]NDV77649.1 hypothetical protein [Dysgonomonas sp. 511]